MAEQLEVLFFYYEASKVHGRCSDGAVQRYSVLTFVLALSKNILQDILKNKRRTKPSGSKVGSICHALSRLKDEPIFEAILLINFVLVARITFMYFLFSVLH